MHPIHSAFDKVIANIKHLAFRGLRHFLLIWALPILLGVVSAKTLSAQQVVASDSAGNYSGGWNNGSNQGFGFGPWSFAITQVTNESYAGPFIGNPADASIVGLEAPAFALYKITTLCFSEYQLVFIS